MTETGAQRFEAAWREACANHENVADAMGRLLDEQGTRLARVEALVAEWPCENFTGDWVCSDDPSRSPESIYIATAYCWPCRLRAALAPEAEGADVVSNVQIDRERGHENVVSLLRATARHPYKGPNDSDASMLLAAADRLRGGYPAGGSNTCQTVARVCELVASLIEGA